jgi:integrase
MGGNMGIRQLNRLTAKAVAQKTKAGLYCDGGNLYLQVTPSASKTWVFRFRSPLTHKMRDMGLGPLHSVGIPEARERAAMQRAAILRGLDPIEERDRAKRHNALAAAKAMTFSACAISYIASHRAGWRNAKHADQWQSTIATYCGPIFGSLPVQDVDTGLVVQVLEPIWATKAETASRLRGRIENVLDWAKVMGYRTGENPARWRGHLAYHLPKLAKKSRVQHHKAMPFVEVPAFVTSLRAISTTVSRCLEFTILTAARTSEAIHAQVEEFDLREATWTIPATRMKAGREHRVPLSPRAAEIVRQSLSKGQRFLFPGVSARKPICNMAMLYLLARIGIPFTVHGFRSSFRDWSAERTDLQREVCEAALAHTISDAAEAAYRRTDLFDKRRILMERWAAFIDASPQEPAVIPIRIAA